MAAGSGVVVTLNSRGLTPTMPEAGHAGRHGVVAHLLPGLVQVEGDPRSAVGAVRALVEGDDLGVEIGPADLAGQRGAVLGRLSSGSSRPSRPPTGGPSG